MKKRVKEGEVSFLSSRHHHHHNRRDFHSNWNTEQKITEKKRKEKKRKGE